MAQLFEYTDKRCTVMLSSAADEDGTTHFATASMTPDLVTLSTMSNVVEPTTLELTPEALGISYSEIYAILKQAGKPATAANVKRLCSYLRTTARDAARDALVDYPGYCQQQGESPLFSDPDDLAKIRVQEQEAEAAYYARYGYEYDE